jgi:hypothetical protein
VQFLGGNDLDDPDRPAGVLTYSFDKRQKSATSKYDRAGESTCRLHHQIGKLARCGDAVFVRSSIGEDGIENLLPKRKIDLKRPFRCRSHLNRDLRLVTINRIVRSLKQIANREKCGCQIVNIDFARTPSPLALRASSTIGGPKTPLTGPGDYPGDRPSDRPGARPRMPSGSRP